MSIPPHPKYSNQLIKNYDYQKILIKTFFHYSWFYNKKRYYSSFKQEPRIFPNYIKEQCWNKSKRVPGRDGSRWRYDAVGNPVMKQLRGCGGIFCHEYDHIYPFSKGGTSTLENCQILQTNVNRMKANQFFSNDEIKKFSMLFPSTLKELNRFQIGEFEMDLAEELVYGNIKKC